jgi:hypothetical protein
MEPEGSSLCSQETPSPRPCVTFRNGLIFTVRHCQPNPEAGGPPLFGSPRLLIKYIRSCPQYLEAISSIRNPRTHHAVVTRDPLHVE